MPTRQVSRCRRSNNSSRLGRKQTPSRSGAVIAELAICTPVLILVSAALIELASMIFVKQGLSVAAYEAAHHAVQPEATNGQALGAANDILNERRITGANVSISPDIASVREGDLFTVRVTAPSDSNGVGIMRLFNPVTLEASVVAMKEFPN
ncbi:MAG: TadE/TadG family type IV pilus assembly protein [Aureliella sp.]